ncbi:icam3 [Pungitius sinensis]
MRWLFVFSGVLLCAGQPASSSCPLQLSPPSPVVRFGDPFRVNCSSTAGQIESMGLESVYGSEKSEGVSSVAMEITSVRDWDMSVICYMNRPNVPQCSTDLPVTVYKTPDRVSISQASLAGPLVEGETYSLECDVVNVAPVRNLSVHWYMGEKMVLAQSFDGSSLSPVNATSVYNLTARRADDQSRIRCEAQLDFWAAVPSPPAVKSESRAVVVLYPPTFAQPGNETLELPAGGKFILNCSATGNPTPVYGWRAPGAVRLTGPEGNRSLLAPPFPLPGTYECTASNTRGSASKYFTVPQAPRNHTTMAALLGAFLSLAVVISFGGLLLLTPRGNFSFSKGGYLIGRPASSAPI